MKYYLTISAALLLILFSCTTGKLPQDASSANDIKNATVVNDTVRIANDELEYEVIIIDAGFNSWLASRAKPRNYYTQQFFENKNRFWVTEWNNRVMQPQRYNNLYQMRIDYDPQIDYGYEVNYLLYNYLVYFQITNGQKLLGVVTEY